MEDTHFEAPKFKESFVFSSHTRLRLRSESYRTLVQILSRCYENPELSMATEIDPQELRAANISPLRQSAEEASCEQIGGNSRNSESGDSATKEVMGCKDCLGMNSVEDSCFNETEVKMDDIKHIVTIERNPVASVNQKTLGASSQCNHSVHEEKNPNELEHITEGNEVLVHDHNNNQTRSSDYKNGENHLISSEKQEFADSQLVTSEENGSMVEELSGTIFSLDSNEIGEVSKEHNQENLLVVGKEMHQRPESQQKELEAEGMVCEHNEKGYHVSSSDAMEVEDGEQCSEQVSEAVRLHQHKDMSCEDHEQSKKSKDKAALLSVDVSKANYEMLMKDMQMDKLLLIPESTVSPNCVIENGDMEEGEICSDDGVANISACADLEDSVVLAEKVVDIQITAEAINRSELPSVQTSGKGKKPASLFFDMAEYANLENKTEFRQNKSSSEACKRGIVVSTKVMRSKKQDQSDFMLEERGYRIKDSENNNISDSSAACFSNEVVHDQVPNAYAAGCKGIVTTEKETGVGNKKKRGPLSEGRKEKKKITKKKKRAEKNRKLGVKRLKLHPVTMPKPVVYCRHFLKGRCHEGDKCKFSHDTIPLTKSTPCSHFARHSCMKGDNCPFDHELSKYPCSNFVSKGSCTRGDTCLFSHKVLGTNESTSTPNLKTESKQPLVRDNLDSQKKVNSNGTLKQNLVVAPKYTGTPRNNTPQSENLLEKKNGPPPIGINFLSFTSSNVDSSKISDRSSQDKNDRSVLNQSGLCLVENSNQLSRKNLPKTAPKRINFLSFAKTTQDVPSNKILATPPSNEGGMKPSEIDNSSLNMQVSPPPLDASFTFDSQIQAILKTGQNSIELLKEVKTPISKQMDRIFPKALVENHVRDELISSSSNWKMGSDLSVQSKKSVHYEYGSSSSLLSRLTETPVSTGQSSESLASSMCKGRPNSVQKALLSTLAFAAKYESLMIKNKFSGSSALSNEGRNEVGNENINKPSVTAASKEGNNEDKNENISGSLKADKAKASKLLDFFLDVGIKSDKRPESGLL